MASSSAVTNAFVQSQLKELVWAEHLPRRHSLRQSCDLEGICSVPCPNAFCAPSVHRLRAQALHGSGGARERAQEPIAAGTSCHQTSLCHCRCQGSWGIRAHPQHSLWSCLLPPPHIPLPDSSTSRLGSSLGLVWLGTWEDKQTCPAPVPVLGLLNPVPGGGPGVRI